MESGTGEAGKGRSLGGRSIGCQGGAWEGWGLEVEAGPRLPLKVWGEGGRDGPSDVTGRQVLLGTTECSIQAAAPSGMHPSVGGGWGELRESPSSLEASHPPRLTRRGWWAAGHTDTHRAAAAGDVGGAGLVPGAAGDAADAPLRGRDGFQQGEGRLTAACSPLFAHPTLYSPLSVLPYLGSPGSVCPTLPTLCAPCFLLPTFRVPHSLFALLSILPSHIPRVSQFKRLLNRELTHLSESSRSGNQVSEYISQTFLDQQAEVEDPQPLSPIRRQREPCLANVHTAAVPRFGVHTDQEEQLAQVGLLAPASVSPPVPEQEMMLSIHRRWETPAGGAWMCSEWPN